MGKQIPKFTYEPELKSRYHFIDRVDDNQFEEFKGYRDVILKKRKWDYLKYNSKENEWYVDVDKLKDIYDVYQLIKLICNPRSVIQKGFLIDAFLNKDKNNFMGGLGDKRKTMHENIFKYLFPYLEDQITYGTGKDGYKKYYSKKYTIDFLEINEGIIYEIDGKNHSKPSILKKDSSRDLFFLKVHNLRTIRLTNEEVEDILFKRLIKLDDVGELLNVIGY